MSEDPDVGSSDCPDLERRHVYDVYHQVAHHFQHSRHRAWPRVRQFLQELEPGSLVADVGCGNGRYLHINHDIFKVGCDYCWPLVEIAKNRKHEAMVCDNLQLPFRDSAFDALVSIAVIHHFTTEERRIKAVQELARVLRPGGKVMIYVWAMEQKHRKFESQDVLIPWHPPTVKNRTRRKRSHGGSSSSFSEDDSSAEAELNNGSKNQPSLDIVRTIREQGRFPLQRSKSAGNKPLRDLKIFKTYKSLDHTRNGLDSSDGELKPNPLFCEKEAETCKAARGPGPTSTHTEKSAGFLDNFKFRQKETPLVAMSTVGAVGSSLTPRRENKEERSEVKDDVEVKSHKQIKNKKEHDNQSCQAPDQNAHKSGSSLKSRFFNFWSHKPDVVSRTGMEGKCSGTKDAAYHNLLHYIMKNESHLLHSRPVLEHSLSASEVEGFAVREFPQSSQPQFTKHISLDSCDVEPQPAKLRDQTTEIYKSQPDDLDPSAEDQTASLESHLFNGNTEHVQDAKDNFEIKNVMHKNDKSDHSVAQIINGERSVSDQGDLDNKDDQGSSESLDGSSLSSRSSGPGNSNNGLDDTHSTEGDSGQGIGILYHRKQAAHATDTNGVTRHGSENSQKRLQNFPKTKDTILCDVLGQTLDQASDTKRGGSDSSSGELLDETDGGRLGEAEDSNSNSELSPRRKGSDVWKEVTAKAIEALQTEISNTDSSPAKLPKKKCSCCSQKKAPSKRTKGRGSPTSSISSEDAYSEVDSDCYNGREVYLHCTGTKNAMFIDTSQSQVSKPKLTAADVPPQDSCQHKETESVSCDQNGKVKGQNEEGSQENINDTCMRYYHVFKENELVELIENHVESLHVLDVCYDHANWCVVAEKVTVWTL